MKCPHCPVPDGVECKSYEALCANLAKNPKRWTPILDRVNAHLEPASATEYPSLATQAANVVGAAARFIGSGFATVDQAEFDRRHAICEACEHFDAAMNRCRKCGCKTKFKLKMANERCPIGSWAAPPSAAIDDEGER